MICTHCKYVLSDFDVECPRCHGKGLPNGTTNQLASHPQVPDVDKETIQSSVSLASHSSPQPRFPRSSFRCPVCGSKNTKKVSAIVNAGTWKEDTSSAQQTQIHASNTGVSVGVVWGEKHHPIVTSVTSGNTIGEANSFNHNSTRGATRLAQMLAES